MLNLKVILGDIFGSNQESAQAFTARHPGSNSLPSHEQRQVNASRSDHHSLGLIIKAGRQMQCTRFYPSGRNVDAGGGIDGGGKVSYFWPG